VVLLLLALIVGVVFVWLGRKGRSRRRWQTRLAAIAFAVVASAGALATALRGAWVAALLLASVAAWLWTRLSTQRSKPELGKGEPEPVGVPMSDQKARAVLGVGPEAGAQEIQAAYLRLIRTVHPDRGGTTGLAAELNAARNQLLGR
jgi:hypothetical protein